VEKPSRRIAEKRSWAFFRTAADGSQQNLKPRRTCGKAGPASWVVLVAPATLLPPPGQAALLNKGGPATSCGLGGGRRKPFSGHWAEALWRCRVPGQGWCRFNRHLQGPDQGGGPGPTPPGPLAFTSFWRRWRKTWLQGKGNPATPQAKPQGQTPPTGRGTKPHHPAPPAQATAGHHTPKATPQAAGQPTSPPLAGAAWTGRNPIGPYPGGGFNPTWQAPWRARGQGSRPALNKPGGQKQLVSGRELCSAGNQTTTGEGRRSGRPGAATQAELGKKRLESFDGAFAELQGRPSGQRATGFGLGRFSGPAGRSGKPQALGLAVNRLFTDQPFFLDQGGEPSQPPNDFLF